MSKRDEGPLSRPALGSDIRNGTTPTTVLSGNMARPKKNTPTPSSANCPQQKLVHKLPAQSLASCRVEACLSPFSSRDLSLAVWHRMKQ